MPRSAVRIHLRVRSLRQRSVRRLSVLQRRRGVDGRTHEGMAKPHTGAELEQSDSFGGGRGMGAQSNLLSCSPQQHGIAHRLGRRDKQ